MALADVEISAIKRATSGDAAALETLLRSHYSRLLQYVKKHLPNELRGVIEPVDVAQDVNFEACRLIGGFKPMGPDCIFRWLATIARHRMIDLLRQARSRKRSKSATGAGGAAEDAVIPLLEQLAVYKRTPSRSAAAHEFMAALEQSLGRLPEEYRKVVMLRHIDGLSVAETSERMGRTQEAIYWLCCRALQAIRTDLQSASPYM